MVVRAIRGAITVLENSKESILEGTRELLVEIINNNDLDPGDVISAIFTVTNDLNAAFPAIAARDLGWTDVALLCSNEIEVPNSLEMCIRVLIHINTEKTKDEIKNVYLKNAAVLRPDLKEKAI